MPHNANGSVCRLSIERKPLIAALQRAATVAPRRYPRPILCAVRLQADAGQLSIAAVDGEVSFLQTLAADGDLPPVAMNCADLLARVRSTRDARSVLTLRARPERLVLVSGRVEHALATLPVEDFPPLPQPCAGETLHLDGEELKRVLGTAQRAVARETSRYAIQGVLLESDADGARCVATDGRRLVVAALHPRSASFQGRVILPASAVRLLVRVASDPPVTLTIVTQTDAKGETHASQVLAGGDGWLLAARAVEGSFPRYADVMPRPGSRFTADREALLVAVRQVALATSEDQRGVRVSLRPRRIELATLRGSADAASARVPARHVGGDATIHTGFNPAYLLDALESLPGKLVLFDVQQNACTDDRHVVSRAAVISSADDPGVRWVVMPIDTGLEPNRETLGSNYREPASDAA